MIEVVWDRELAGAQPERPGLVGRSRYGPDFDDGTVIAHYEESFSRLNAVQEGKGVSLNLLNADCAHIPILGDKAGWRKAASRDVH